jgi:VanZ family protein
VKGSLGSALVAWLPVILWMLVITRASADEFAAPRTLVWIEWLLRGVWADAGFEAVFLANFVARKLAHVTEYAIFAVLLVRAFRSKTGPTPQAPTIAAVAAAAVLALGDEGRQAVSSARSGSLLDYVTDLGGAGLGALFSRSRDG